MGLRLPQGLEAPGGPPVSDDVGAAGAVGHLVSRRPRVPVLQRVGSGANAFVVGYEQIGVVRVAASLENRSSRWVVDWWNHSGGGA